MENQILDSDFTQKEPDTKIEYAGFWIRALASLLDSLVLVPVFLLMLVNFAFIKSLPLELFFVLIMFFYKPFMEFSYGSTLGKMVTKIKVVNHDMEKISIADALFRYSPWMPAQLISLYLSAELFNLPQFAETTTFIESFLLYGESTSQADTVSNVFNVLLLISCLFAAFTEKKRALHDMVAGTYCIYKR